MRLTVNAVGKGGSRRKKSDPGGHKSCTRGRQRSTSTPPGDCRTAGHATSGHSRRPSRIPACTLLRATWVRCPSGQTQQGPGADWQVCAAALRGEEREDTRVSGPRDTPVPVSVRPKPGSSSGGKGSWPGARAAKPLRRKHSDANELGGVTPFQSLRMGACPQLRFRGGEGGGAGQGGTAPQVPKVRAGDRGSVRPPRSRADLLCVMHHLEAPGARLSHALTESHGNSW